MSVVRGKGVEPDASEDVWRRRDLRARVNQSVEYLGI